uniref:Sulfatase domain-containing protein n=1 Tax=Rhabditophanes sp. KR3021 TaxID=114890 RepID=A0AC35TMK3_9BILA
MTEKLLKAGRDADWPLVSKLMFEHWSETCPKLYHEGNDKPWQYCANEAKIYDELVRPVAALLNGNEDYVSLDVSQPDRGCNLKGLSNEVGYDLAGNMKGQICGSGFKSGDVVFHCRHSLN